MCHSSWFTMVSKRGHQLITMHPQTRSRKQRTLGFSSLSPFYTLHGSLGNGATNSGHIFPSQNNPQQTFSLSLISIIVIKTVTKSNWGRERFTWFTHPDYVHL